MVVHDDRLRKVFDFYLALFQIGFLYFCSAFFFRGIGNLREKRLLIRRLREEDQRRVEELTRLTQELDLKSRELVAANQKIRQADRLNLGQISQRYRCRHHHERDV